MRLFHAAPALLVSLCSCSAILGLDDKPLDPDAGHDASPLRDAAEDARMPPRDAGHDVAKTKPDGALDAAVDAPVDAAPACTADEAGFTDLTRAACWSTFAYASGSVTFAGGTFDGRYVYFAGTDRSEVARYDTHGAFDSVSAWSVYLLDTIPEEFAGMSFDGRYLYLAPDEAASDDYFLRYDTQYAADGAGFTNRLAWVAFSPSATTELDFAGTVFDGRYVYYVPRGYDDGFDYTTPGLVVRYDTQYATGDASVSSFSDQAAWESFAPTQISASASSFQGGVYDGTYVYFIPSGGDATALLRYDPRGHFDVATSWSTVDLSTLGGPHYGGAGAVFDGRYLSIVPATGGYDALQYDTKRAFESSSFVPYVVPGSVSGTAYGGGAFDGQNAYFVPQGGPSLGAPSGTNITRFDKAGAFTNAASWSTFAPSSIGASAFQGAVFDGQYLYFAPSGMSGSSIFARYEARGSSLFPTLPAFHGSFY